MRIAVRYRDVLIDPDGHVAGHDAGATLVRRLLRVFPGAIVVGDGPRRCDGFDVLPLEFLDARETVVINMDVVDSMSVWRTLRQSCDEPKVMNFVWWTTSQFTHPVDRAALGLSCALFPTFANSQRTATEIQEIVGQQVVQPLAEQTRIGWVNLGIRLEHVHPRQEPAVPVVLYPAIYLSERKAPQVFFDVVERVRKHVPVRVEARLVESHLVSEQAMRLSRHEWVWMGPLTASRDDYWEALSRTTAFLATATDESYGLEYIEALVAGAVGVFPDRPWARAILPADYPFLYSTTAQAEELLLRAVSDPAGCRRQLDDAAGGDFQDWLRARHDDDAFDRSVVEHVRRWFG
ncbi:MULTISPECIES: hypothetical protein [Cellulomonas]|uniref:Glycosyl transferase group 1 n=1 Tax=Cellulomonas gilvus (strain ATCC 13127 / NRRL B-14078) TaxID=593907 RepID=F8A100_CELGA|nr:MULTISPECIES: hypothetical protein [Cellulomonas]AEI12758.1 hypothetical protein Celgi_2258 [Cellulomonas gilvus ATCC 13127]MCR6689492.1 glycosyltransferase family 1 protein [Cellulomonas sp.]